MSWWLVGAAFAAPWLRIVVQPSVSVKAADRVNDETGPPPEGDGPIRCCRTLILPR